MGLIKKASELEVSPAVKVMIYGQPGMGKTTLALSAPKPLLLDFDNGVKRVNDTHLDGVDIVQVTAWGEVLQLLRDTGSLAPYETIVVDTVGKMVEYITTYVCGNRQPQLRDWGKINGEFSTFCRLLGDLRKNIIFVAHRDSRKEGEDTVFIPSLREKNYNSIVTELDLLGYLEMRSDRGVAVRTITFDPTNRNDGKNTCGLPASMTIPEVISREGAVLRANDFLSSMVIKPYVDMQHKKAEQRREYEKLIRTIADDVALISTAAQANAYVATMKGYNHIGNSLEKARVLFGAKVKDLGLEYDATTKTYSDGLQPQA